MAELVWTHGQLQAIGQIQAHLWMGAAERPYVLKGYAGTGKTTLLMAALAGLDRVLVLAPTHKAAGVLSAKLAGLPIPATICTLHKALGYAPVLDEETGEEVFVRSGESWIGRLAGRAATTHERIGVIVDEVSMIGRELWAELHADLVRYQVRAVLMGDPLQLPPVREELSPAFAAGPGCELTEVMRSQGVLTDAVLSVRERIEDVQAPWLWDSSRDGHGQIVAHRAHTSMRATWLDMLSAGDDVVIVGWTNRAVQRANAEARAHIAGDSAQPFVAGEWLVLIKPFCLVLDEDTEHERREFVHVETRARITRASLSRHKSGQEAWRLELVSKDQGAWVAYALDPMQAKQVREEAKRLLDEALTFEVGTVKRRTLMERRLKLLGLYLWARPHYATTVHKSQGSTWDHVFVMRDLLANKRHLERNKLIYVAVSRAARSLHMGVW